MTWEIPKPSLQRSRKSRVVPHNAAYFFSGSEKSAKRTQKTEKIGREDGEWRMAERKTSNIQPALQKRS
jgi:hypothetical protein